MKRQLIIAGVFLLLGVIINVALAWGCTLWSPAKRTAVRSVGPWPAPVGEEWPEVANLSTTAGFGFAETQGDGWLRHMPPQFGYTSQWSFVAGWPCYAMYTARGRIWIAPDTTFQPVQATTPSNLAEGITVSDNGGALKLEPGRFLPTQPLWTGFFVNTLFFATTLWLLIPGPRVVKRFIRLKRGQCGACGYPVGVSPLCTECGKPVTPKPVEIKG